jgi:hypothetical protein
VLAIALFEAGQLEVVGKEGAAGHFTSGWRPQPGGTSGAKDCEKSLIARSPGFASWLAERLRGGAKTDATKTDATGADGEADEADVDADLFGLNCLRLRAGVPWRTSRLRPQ